jgi:hypothetical protein
MGFSQGMHVSPLRRIPRRLVAAAAGAALLALPLTGCGPEGKASSKEQVTQALAKLGAQQSATMIAGLVGSPDQVRDFFRQAGHGPFTDGVPSTQEATLLARAEFTMSLAAPEEDQRLRELKDWDKATVATTLNFGGKDIAAYKLVGKKAYLRLRVQQLSEVVGRRDGWEQQGRALADLARSAEGLPDSLKAPRDLLQGRFVRFDPQSFQQFSYVAQGVVPGTEAEEPVEVARDVLAAMDGTELRDLLRGLGTVLHEQADFGTAHEDGDTTRITATMPGRKTAGELAPLLEPFGVHASPDSAPAGDVHAQLLIRRGVLQRVTLDLGQFTGEPDAHLPLRLDLASGDALSVKAPAHARKMAPQDLLAAVLYGKLDSPNF